MTPEEKARAYDEALDRMKHVVIVPKNEKALQALKETIFPELAESEDERIRKELIETIGCISSDSECAIFLSEQQKQRYLAYLEKQKDASKAIDAVERIDKYIDLHLANAHDMKDSNPDKKYYRGWDDALGKMAGILQDVYSGEKKKESLGDFIDNFPYSDQKEQNEDVPLQPIIYTEQGEVLAKQKPKEPGYKHEDYFCERCQANAFNAGRESVLKEQKPVEWSKEDELMMKAVIGCLNEKKHPKLCAFLKSLRPGWKPTEEQMDALAYAIQILDDGLSPKAAKAGEELEGIREHFKKL